MLTAENLSAALEAFESKMAGRIASLQAGPLTGNPIAAAFRESSRAQAALGTDFARCLMTEAARRRGVSDIKTWAAKRWDDETVEKLAIGSDTIAGGGAAVPEILSNDFIESLRADQVVSQLGPRMIDIGAHTSIPGIATGVTGSWIGENQRIKQSQPTFKQIVATPKQCAVIVPIGNFFLQHAIAGAEGFVRDDAVMYVGEALDAAYINGLGTQFTPKGMRQWASSGNKFNANGTITVKQTAKELANCQSLVESAKLKMRRPGWLMSPRTKHGLRTMRDEAGWGFRKEMEDGLLDGHPYRATPLIPNNEGGSTDESYVIFADFDAVVIGRPRFTIDMSTEATTIDADGNQFNAFQENLTLLRVIVETDLIVRHADAISVISQVKWGKP